MSPLALAAMDLLDWSSPDYALDVVSLIEATLEGPGPVLSAQRFKARGEAVQAMKADGIEYEERMALLEDVDYPKPLADVVEVAFESYRSGHPWIAEYQPEPKSVVRDLYERAMTFSEYIAFYQLQRSEGVVLRYLADAYRAMRRTVPPDARTRGADRPGLVARRAGARRRLQPARRVGGAGPPGRDERTRRGGRQCGRRPRPAGSAPMSGRFTVMVRNALFRRVELLARWAASTPWASWTAPRAGTPTAGARRSIRYWDEYDSLGVGRDGPLGRARADRARARRPGPCGRCFDDPAGDRDWGISARSTWPRPTRSVSRC